MKFLEFGGVWIRYGVIIWIKESKFFGICWKMRILVLFMLIGFLGIM